MLQSITNAVLNTIFVSIPEEFIWVVFTLILLKRRDLLDIYFWKQNLKQIMIPVLPVAISINLMRYILHIDRLTNFIIIEIMMSCLVIFLVKKNNFLNEKINYFKIIFYVILADFITIITTEGLCVLIVLPMLNITIDQINNNILMNITLSFLPRTLQILLISFCIYKQTIGKMINCIELILRNKVLTISMTIFLTTVLITNYAFQLFITNIHYLDKYILTIKMCLIVLIVLIPVVIITSFIVSVFSLLLENSKLRQEKEIIYDDTI